MIVDIQQHYVPAAMRAAYEETGLRKSRPNETDLEHRLVEIDAFGGGCALLAVPGPAHFRTDRRAEDVRVFAASNDELLEVAATYPGRFGVLAALPFPFAKECVAEFERVRTHPLVRGVILFAASEHWTLDLPELQEVYESIAAAGMTAMLHPGADQFVRLPVMSDWNLGINLGAVFESSTAVARLMLSGMLDRVPDLTLVIPHLGGVLPYLAQRSIDQSGSGAAQHDMLHYLRERCLLDSCSYYPPALTCAIETVTADRVLLGTDYPYRGSIIRGIEDIARSELAEDVKDAILAGNAQRVGLAVPS